MLSSVLSCQVQGPVTSLQKRSLFSNGTEIELSLACNKQNTVYSIIFYLYTMQLHSNVRTHGIGRHTSRAIGSKYPASLTRIALVRAGTKFPELVRLSDKDMVSQTSWPTGKDMLGRSCMSRPQILTPDLCSHLRP